MTDERSPPRDAAITAAEYALRLLSGTELENVRAREASDPQFRTQVQRWRGWLAPLHDEIEPVAPPASLWKRIEGETSGAGSSNTNVLVFRRKLTLWRSVAGVMTAAAASLALIIGFVPRSPPPPKQGVLQTAAAPMVALLGNQGSIKAVASWDPAARQLVLAVPGELPTDAAHSRQLWVIPSGGRPRALGTMSPSKQMHFRVADALATLFRQGATIAISIEPPGGSPTGSPTGPVVASGTLSQA